MLKKISKLLKQLGIMKKHTKIAFAAVVLWVVSFSLLLESLMVSFSVVVKVVVVLFLVASVVVAAQGLKLIDKIYDELDEEDKKVLGDWSWPGEYGKSAGVAELNLR